MNLRCVLKLEQTFLCMSTLKTDWIFLKVFIKSLLKVMIFSFDIDSLILPVIFFYMNVLSRMSWIHLCYLREGSWHTANWAGPADFQFPFLWVSVTSAIFFFLCLPHCSESNYSQPQPLYGFWILQTGKRPAAFHFSKPLVNSSL